MGRDQVSDILIKSVVAAAFFFFLQYVILKSSLETSVLWAGALGLAAACLAWSQSRR